MCEHLFVRWDDQSVEREAARSLPGLDVERVRTFDAPEALGINFHEVRAKSALNRVPGSYLPFNYTVNPYRGCSHACNYCLEGRIPVLMADGRTKPIAELSVGDRIYGTVRGERYRYYAVTEVLAHWATRKEAFRITLEDGTELIASGSHRFLSDRGWKYVTGTECGPMQRPHLTTNNKLIGTGHYAAAPIASADYRRGYLCGMIRGDGHLGVYSYTRPGRNIDDHYRFRLALADLEPLIRAKAFLSEFAVETDEFAFAAAGATTRPIRAIRTSARGKVVAIRQLIEWPRLTSDDWCKGFLAGIFDAEGHCSAEGILRIANTDSQIIDWIAYCLRRLAFRYTIEHTRNPNGLRNVRLLGGLRARLRLYHSTDPAITRKRRIKGMALKSDAKLRVVSIEPVGKSMPMYDITTETGDFIANGVVSHNCFARNTHTYLDMDAGRDFEREIVVKVNVPELLAAELRRPSWKRELVAFGTNTDPYQWAEGRYRLMPPMLDALRETRTPASILTKSPLVLRDLDRVVALSKVADVSVNFSVPTLDEKIWRQTEPHTPSPRKRLEAVAKFNQGGIPSGVLIAPLMPGINDDPELVDEIVELAREAGATFVNGIALHLRPGVHEVFMSWLSAARPDLVPRYEHLYSRGSYALPQERKRIGKLVKGFSSRDYRRETRRRAQEREAEEEREAPEQQALF